MHRSVDRDGHCDDDEGVSLRALRICGLDRREGARRDDRLVGDRGRVLPYATRTAETRDAAARTPRSSETDGSRALHARESIRERAAQGSSPARRDGYREAARSAVRGLRGRDRRAEPQAPRPRRRRHRPAARQARCPRQARPRRARRRPHRVPPAIASTPTADATPTRSDAHRLPLRRGRWRGGGGATSGEGRQPTAGCESRAPGAPSSVGRTRARCAPPSRVHARRDPTRESAHASSATVWKRSGGSISRQRTTIVVDVRSERRLAWPTAAESETHDLHEELRE